MVEASSEEELERLVRRSSKAKWNASRSPRTRLVLVDSTNEEEEDLQPKMSSRLRASRRKLSSASLSEKDFMSMRTAKAGMRWNSSSVSLCIQDSEDDYSDSDEEAAPQGLNRNMDNVYAPLRHLFNPPATHIRRPIFTLRLNNRPMARVLTLYYPLQGRHPPQICLKPRAQRRFYWNT